MHKNAIKIEIFQARGQFSNKMRLKTGDFPAIFGQKAGEFGEYLNSNWRFLTTKILVTLKIIINKTVELEQKVEWYEQKKQENDNERLKLCQLLTAYEQLDQRITKLEHP